jgi:hypothetical protein
MQSIRMKAFQWPALLLCLAFASCSSYGPGSLKTGQTSAEVEAELGPPTARYPRPEGGTRLEFARGPFGKHTFMVDLDTAGRVQRWQQVLQEAQFNQVKPGMKQSDLLFELGRPSHVNGIWRGATVWSWRYDTRFCQWFQVTLEPDGTVRDAGYGPDPLCEADDLEHP